MDDFFSSPKELLRLMGCHDQVSSLTQLAQINADRSGVVEQTIELAMTIGIAAALRFAARQELNLDRRIVAHIPITWRDLVRE